jgi:anaerobic selenocysteine-containing dehydrogenase
VSGKVKTDIDRVYAPDRILTPLVCTGRKGDPAFRPAGWDEALDIAAAGIRDAITRHGGETLLPYSFLGNQGALQGNAVSGRLMNALGVTALERTICDAAAISGSR